METESSVLSGQPNDELTTASDSRGVSPHGNDDAPQKPTRSPRVEIPTTAHTGGKRVRLLTVGLVLLTVVLYGRGLSQSRGEFGDSFHHLINGIFVYDALQEPLRALSDPWAFGHRYYLSYPAISIGYYMPAFPMMEAGLMSVFGVSPVVGQITVLLHAVLLTVCAFAWFRLRLDVGWAAGATVALISTPLLVQWGRDIMLEIPMLAYATASVLFLERLLRSERFRWSDALLWALTASLAFWVKQHALMLVGVYGLTVVASRRWRAFISPAFLTASVLIAIAAGGVIFATTSMGGDAVGHTVGFNRAHAIDRLNLDQWTYYLRQLPNIAGWPTVLLAALGLFLALREPQKSLTPVLAWIVCFYVMHSYFKAQSVRYACLWLPPFFLLAAGGVQFLGRLLAAGDARRAGIVGAGLLVVYAGTELVRGARVPAPYVSPAYQRAADDLCEMLSPYTCLTFFPDRPGRAAVCFRLAVERRRSPERDIYAHGRILRAGQVLRNWRERWTGACALAADLAEWNVKYILTESPQRLDTRGQDAQVSAALEAVLALGEFRPLRTYLAVRKRGSLIRRTVTLYERIKPLEFNPEARPPIRTGRVPTDVGRVKPSENK